MHRRRNTSSKSRLPLAFESGPSLGSLHGVDVIQWYRVADASYWVRGHFAARSWDSRATSRTLNPPQADARSESRTLPPGKLAGTVLPPGPNGPLFPLVRQQMKRAVGIYRRVTLSEKLRSHQNAIPSGETAPSPGCLPVAHRVEGQVQLFVLFFSYGNCPVHYKTLQGL